MVNGCLLFAAERFRRRAEVRELAIARRAPSRTARASWTRSSIARRWSSASAQSTRARRRHQPRRRDDGRGPRARPRPQRLGALRVPARDPDHPRRGPRSSCPTCSATSATGFAARRSSAAWSAAVTAVFTVALPGRLLQDEDARAVRRLLPAVRPRDGHLHAGVAATPARAGAGSLPGRWARMHHH